MNRVHNFFVFTLGAPALAAVSTLAPHPAVGPLDPAVRPQLIAQSGQGLPSFPEIVDAVKPSVIGVRTKVAPVSRKSKDQHRSGMSEDQLLPFGAPEGWGMAPPPPGRCPGLPYAAPSGLRKRSTGTAESRTPALHKGELLQDGGGGGE